jgi:hypothetical protein
MSFRPTAFRQFASGPFGPRANFRNASVDWPGGNDEAGNATAFIRRGQMGNIVYRSPGGFSNHQLAGVTRDSAGVALGFCRVDLCQANIIVTSLISDASGNFLFKCPGSGPFFIVAYKQGSPDVAGTTVNTLQPELV